MLRPASNSAGSTRWLILFFGATLLALAAVAESVVARGPLRDIYPAYLFPAVGALYVVTGTVAWWRRPSNRLGALMIAAGTATIVSGYANSGLAEFVAVGAVVAGLPLAIFLHVVHASPTGKVRGRPERATVAAAYLVFLILQVPIWAFTPEPSPFDAVTISPHAGLAELGRHAQEVAGAAVVIVTLWLIGRRLRSYAIAERRLLATTLGLAVLAVLTAVLGKTILPPLGLDVIEVADVQLAAAALLPFGFLLVVLRGGFARSDELRAFTRVVAAPAGTAAARRELDQAVVAALGDPTAVLLRWTAAGYVDAAGVPASLDPVAPHRSVFAIDGHDAPLGAVVYDSLLGSDPAALGAVATVVGFTLERERLAREVSDSRAALQEASQRVLLAGDLERRRVARDLHDGLQGKLVLLSMQARELAQDAAGRAPGGTASDVAGRADLLAGAVDTAARTLRGLVDGVMPPPLVERGLVAAVRELAEDLPIPADVRIVGLEGHLPLPVENTAYFVIAEAVTNVVKHADAGRVCISGLLDGDELVLEVHDDGLGGAKESAGSGLAGLRDRLSILGGSMEIASSPEGTRVVARLPCG